MSRKKKNEAWGENGFEDWGGYMAAKKAKLEEQFHNEANKEFSDASSLFHGIAIFVNGYTDPTADELRRLMMAHGGVYHHYMRPQITTHIIASNLPYSKIVMYRKSQNPIPICKPEWITDSLKAGRILNFQDYLLYTNCTDTQPKLAYAVKNQKQLTEKTEDDKIEKMVNESKSSESGNNTVKPIITKSDPVEETPGASNDPSTVPSIGPKTNARCTKDSGFLSEFYSHSRLHHIATMGATFKDYVNELRDKSDGKFPGRVKLVDLKEVRKFNAPPDPELIDEVLDTDDEIRTGSIQEPALMHIDMDCFFVSVGIRNKPELKGLPVAVTHAKGNKYSSSTSANSTDTTADDGLGSLSEVASCSYEARKAGVKNGMFLGEALKICPNLKTIPYDFEGYTEVSYVLYDTVASYTLDIEAVSCDELYADCTKILEEACMSPLEFATVIRNEIREKTGCPVSTGFGSNKLLARLATRKAKPDGQFHIQKEQAEDYLDSFNVRDLPGVGGTTAYKLNGINVRTCAELRAVPLTTLQNQFGKKTGEMLYNMSRGIDHSKLNLEHVRKSVSAEVNYGIRFENNGDAVDFLKKLSIEVCNRLKHANAKGRCITLKLLVRAKEAPKDPAKFMGHGLCDYITRSKNLISPVNDVAIITKEVVALWNQLQQVPEDMRGIGIQISRLEILKLKSRHGTLMNFMNKADSKPKIVNNGINVEVIQESIIPPKQESTKTSKAQDLEKFFPHKQQETSDPENPGTSDKTPGIENFNLPLGINKSVFGELPKDIQDEILGLAHSGNIQGLLDARTDVGKEQCQEEKQLGEASTDVRDVSPSGNLTILEPVVPSLKDSECSSTITKNSKTNDLSANVPPPLGVGGSKTLAKAKLGARGTQSLQENFFKHTKPNATRSTKIEMPALKDIDMTVLIELPEDVRNEILNEYSVNKERNQSNEVGVNVIQKPTSNESTESEQTENNARRDVDHDISFSQVDPEFLAALSDDLRRDVEIYCTEKKTQRKSKEERIPIQERAKSVKAPAVQKQNKKVERSTKPKNNGKGSKAPSLKTNKGKNVPDILKAIERTNVREESKALTTLKSGIHRDDNYKNSDIILTQEDKKTIISRNRSFARDDKKINQHEEMLINLVNHLFKLPLKEVKMQIERWISNTKVVNDVDFVSLATFLSMLPEKKRIEDLHVLMKTMHRCMTKTGDCIWHRTYRKTVKHVQHYMQVEYKSNLMVPPIRCIHLQCNSDVL